MAVSFCSCTVQLSCTCLVVAQVYSAIDRRIGYWINGQFTSDTVAETVQLQLQRPAYAFKFKGYYLMRIEVWESASAPAPAVWFANSTDYHPSVYCIDPSTPYPLIHPFNHSSINPLFKRYPQLVPPSAHHVSRPITTKRKKPARFLLVISSEQPSYLASSAYLHLS